MTLTDIKDRVVAAASAPDWPAQTCCNLCTPGWKGVLLS
jgi:hypothetical protein